jgi:hypothetical protein
MAFGQQSGPPASQKQVHELLALLNEAGHTDFRDARGPLGLTQRQSAGKFTRDEVVAFIDLLQEANCDGESAVPVPVARLSPRQQVLRDTPSEQLAVELRRRGWHVAEPATS